VYNQGFPVLIDQLYGAADVRLWCGTLTSCYLCGCDLLSVSACVLIWYVYGVGAFIQFKKEIILDFIFSFAGFHISVSVCGTWRNRCFGLSCVNVHKFILLGRLVDRGGWVVGNPSPQRFKIRR
jgi:hypothetical protein